MKVMHNLTIRYPAKNLALRQPTLPQIQRAQDYLAQFPQVEMEPQHRFADGMYCRNLPIPADTIVVGKIHRHEHFVVLTKGSATINTDKGMETITAPHTWVSKPGAKRILKTITDCEFMTFHLNPTNTTDLDELEADIIVAESSPFPSLTDDIQRIYA